MVRTTIFVVAAFLISAAHADSRQDSVSRLMKAQGVAEMFDQQRQYERIEGEKQAKKMLDQFLSRMNPNEAFKRKFSAAAMNYMKKLEFPWSSEEITSAWAQYYGAKFTDQELSQLVAFYESPLGQKEQKASKEALLQFSEHFRKLGEPIVEKATNEYITELQITAKECKCSK